MSSSTTTAAEQHNKDIGLAELGYSDSEPLQRVDSDPTPSTHDVQPPAPTHASPDSHPPNNNQTILSRARTAIGAKPAEQTWYDYIVKNNKVLGLVIAVITLVVTVVGIIVAAVLAVVFK